MAVVGFVALVQGVLGGPHPLLLEQLAQLAQPHVGVVPPQARQLQLLEGGEGGAEPALGVALQGLGHTGDTRDMVRRGGGMRGTGRDIVTGGQGHAGDRDMSGGDGNMGGTRSRWETGRDRDMGTGRDRDTLGDGDTSGRDGDRAETHQGTGKDIVMGGQGQ